MKTDDPDARRAAEATLEERHPTAVQVGYALGWLVALLSRCALVVVLFLLLGLAGRLL